MKKQQLHTKKALADCRKELRSNRTPAEAFLWSPLKTRKFEGRRFTKQHSIGNYIVDFYYAAEKLIIALVGEVPNNPNAQVYDENRTKYSENLRLQVIRFENKMVFEKLSFLLTEINNNFITNRK